MTTSTILLILLSVIISGVVAFYQYLFKVDSQNKINWLLAFLRFISVFSLLLLIINPVVSRKIVETNATRKRVADTDIGKDLKNQIKDLKMLLAAYRKGFIKERFPLDVLAIPTIDGFS